MIKKKKQLIKPERTYRTTVTYTCPVRGVVSQEIDVKVYPAAGYNDRLYGSEEVAELLRQEGVLPFEEEDEPLF